MAMPRKRKREADELQEMGFELEQPQDEFSYQPDSGGTIGGARGKQEYGIDTEVDAQDRIPDDDGKNMRRSSAGEKSTTLPADEFFAPQGARLEALIFDRLFNHPRLQVAELEVRVLNRHIIVSGSVATVAAKTLVNEIVEAVAPDAEVRNLVRVDAQQPAAR